MTRITTHAQTSVIYTRRGEFIAGLKDTLPLMLGAAPFGIIFGALAITSGLSVGATLGMSLFVFAGSSQFIAVGLLARAASLPVIILTTFVGFTCAVHETSLAEMAAAARLLAH
jgi:predicted branched-subunit amino acid permease